MNKRGFTIVETLVAITVLMIAIVGPLTVANSALTAALNAKNQMIAINLAQETMEYVKNVKDNNVSAGNDWLQGSNGSNNDISNCKIVGGETATLSKSCGADPIAQTISSCNSINNCLLSVDTTNSNYVYTSSNPTSLTPFTRSFYVSLANDSSNTTEGMLTVIVSWNVGSVPNQVQLQEYISSAAR